MRYRALSPTEDYTFGRSLGNFLVNTPEAVAQAVLTRLRLSQGEWFLDTTAGTPYNTQILGKHSLDVADQAIRTVILGTEGVTEIVSYASILNNRQLTITVTINTLYGQTTVSTPI